MASRIVDDRPGVGRWRQHSQTSGCRAAIVLHNRRPGDDTGAYQPRELPIDTVVWRSEGRSAVTFSTLRRRSDRASGDCNAVRKPQK